MKERKKERKKEKISAYKRMRLTLGNMSDYACERPNLQVLQFLILLERDGTRGNIGEKRWRCQLRNLGLIASTKSVKLHVKTHSTTTTTTTSPSSTAHFG